MGNLSLYFSGNWKYVIDNFVQGRQFLSLSVNVLPCKYGFQMPKTKEEWLSEEWNYQWQFPHCLGSIEENHVTVQAQVNSGSEYYNYKGLFSIIFLAVVGAN